MGLARSSLLMRLKRQNSITTWAASVDCFQQQPQNSSTLLRCVPVARPTAITNRHFSDNILGHSPMAHGGGTLKSGDGAIPTQQDVTVAGGVWAPTSAKRDKLAELKVELPEGVKTLDDAASELEMLDLYLADGLSCIARTTDQVAAVAADSQPLQEMDDWLTQQTARANLPAELHQVQWEEHLNHVIVELDRVLAAVPPETCLKGVRDFYDGSKDTKAVDAAAVADLKNGRVASIFDQATTRFRLLLTKAAAENMLNSWTTVTTISDQDVDRAATTGVTLESTRSTLPTDQLHQVLRSYLTGTCVDRVDAVWALLDRDQDGLLDEAEMNSVCHTAIQPFQTALSALMQESLDAYPLRAPLVDLDKVIDDDAPPPGWRQRRKETKEKKRLMKMIQLTLKKHFVDEVELAHRMRCIYAWSEKAHQDGSIASVMVEEEGWNAKQRYVELHPKISLPEFREVQEIHFTHLDRVGAEYLKSFREDLWVSQGKGRQNRELMRDCGIFLGVVSVIDYIIIAL